MTSCCVDHFILLCRVAAPCVPQEVTAQMLCGNNTGVVSWAEDENVDSYYVQALGPDGHKIFCDSVTNSCQLPSMHCGQTYNLTVTAQDGRCDNSDAYLNLKSGRNTFTYSLKLQIIGCHGDGEELRTAVDSNSVLGPFLKKKFI